MELTDTRYEVDNGLAWITIDRPERLNAFRARTVDELIDCFKRAWADADVGVVCLTGAGERAFCVGGDQKQRAETGDYGPQRSGLFEIERLHRLIREVPKPVIAAVNGLAIGGGHVLHVLCDLTIAADHAQLRPGRPARRLLRRRLRHRLPRARRGREARPRDLVPLPALRRRRPPSGGGWSTRSSPPPSCAREVRAWADDMLALSPTALRFLKQSFNADTEHIAGIAALVVQRARAVLRHRRGARGRPGIQRGSRARLLGVPGPGIELAGGRPPAASVSSPRRGARSRATPGASL